MPPVIDGAMSAVAEKNSKNTPKRSKIYQLYLRNKQLKESLYNLASIIVNLTQVDGAVIITEKFRVIGFGAEIKQ